MATTDRSRVIVISGASAGLGRALALCHAAPGVVLGLTGRNSERLEAVAVACRERGAEVVAGCVDARDEAAVRAWIGAFDSSHPIDLLIANAGVASTLAALGEWENSERMAEVIDINLYGTLHMTQPVIERMRARRSGHVAVVSSLAGLRGMAVSPAYCASKAALIAWCDAVRPVLGRDGIHVSIVLPGFVKTAMSDAFPGSKPFMWSAEKAADYIKDRLARRSNEIAFPFSLALGTKLLRVLPSRMADAILDRMFYLPARKA